jgi:hypothetical protein
VAAVEVASVLIGDARAATSPVAPEFRNARALDRRCHGLSVVAGRSERRLTQRKTPGREAGGSCLLCAKPNRGSSC